MAKKVKGKGQLLFNAYVCPAAVSRRYTVFYRRAVHNDDEILFGGGLTGEVYRYFRYLLLDKFYPVYKLVGDYRLGCVGGMFFAWIYSYV